MPDRDSLFAVLEPPPGGAARLAERLEQRERRVVSSAARAIAAGLAAVAVALVFFSDFFGREGPAPRPLVDGATPPATVGIYESGAFDRLLGRPTSTGEPRVSVDNEPVALARAETGNPTVQIYTIP